MPSSPSRRSTTGWRVGGPVALVFVLLGLGLVLVLDLRSDGDTERPVEDDPEFVLVDDLCDVVSFSPVFEIYAFIPAEVQEREERGSIPQKLCIFDESTRLDNTNPSPRGLLVAHSAVYDTPEAARHGYDGLRTRSMDFRDGPEELARRWDRSAILREDTVYGSEVELMVLDGILLLNLRLAISSWGAPPDLDTQQAALVEVADSMREVMRQ